MVCLLYLSIGGVFAAIHHHENDSLTHEPCAACAWHHENQVDVPIVLAAFEKPRPLVFSEQPAHTFFRELSLKIHPSRGPPVLPL